MRQNVRRALAIASITLPMQSCSTLETATVASEALCISDKPITFSATKDTPETVSQVREHNAAWDAVCSNNPAGAILPPPWAR